MAVEQDEDLRDYNVVVNHEEQYSIWFRDREVPAGWRIVEIPSDWWRSYQEQHATVRGPHAKQVCLDYIEVIWTDMRPLSLRRAMSA